MELYYQLDLYEWIFLIGLCLSAIGLTRFYIRVYAKIPRYASPAPGAEKKPVSVVLSGKNQYDTLKKNLTFWLEQKYPHFEIVVVYDNDDEDIAALLRDFARRYNRLKPINANQRINFFDEKKFSLSIGVKSAEHDYVILTDPRFRPASEHCIDYIQAAFRPQTNIVIGHPAYTGHKKRVCSFPAYLIMENTLQYLGFALGGRPFAGRRALIAYRKQFFLDHQGYTDTYALNTGIFDRIRRHIKKANEVNVQIAPEAEVRFSGDLRLETVLRSERQYLTTLYSEKSKARNEIKTYRYLIPVFFLFLISGLAWFGFGMLHGKYPEIPIWILLFGTVALVKFIVQAVIMQKAGNSIRGGQVWFCLPLYEILYLPLQLVLTIGRKFGRQ